MKKKVYLFPGQGSQYIGMGKKLCDTYEIAKKTFDEANEILGFDLKKLCFEGNINELTKTINLQPALLTYSVASYLAFTEEYGARPDYLAGHSLGEISALTCAGVINFNDAIKITYKRGKLMQEAVADGIGSMAAIRNIESAKIEQVCHEISGQNGYVAISNYNSRNQIVIAGYKNNVEAAIKKLEAIGADAKLLNVSAPFHCKLMEPITSAVQDELSKYTYNDTKYKVMSNVTARPYEGKAEVVKLLTEQITKPVRWMEIMDYLRKKSVEIGIELGAGHVLRSLDSAIYVFSYDDDNDKKAIKDLDLESKLPFFSRAMGIITATPNTNWDENEYQKGVVESYKVIQKLSETYEANKTEPSEENMRFATDMLVTALKTKGAKRDEIISRLEQLFWDTRTENIFTNITAFL